jgi:hypothetical protein
MFLDRDAHLADLGLLGRSLFRCENLHSALLDFLGFLWILARIEIYQGVTRNFRWKNFLAPFASRTFETPERRPLTRLCERQTCSSGQPTLISDFTQLIVAPARLSRASTSHGLTLQLTQ